MTTGDRILGKVGAGLRGTILGAWLVAVVFPMLWLFYTSAKSTQEVYANPFGLPRLLTSPSAANAAALVENYRKAWVESHFSLYFLNSIKVVGSASPSSCCLGAWQPM
jgi:ABC-type glycerol-3-phosphate transport system permease component